MTPIKEIELNAIFPCNCNIPGFAPKATYAYDDVAKTVTVTDATTLPAGETLKVIHAKVHDDFGNSAYGHIDALAGNVAVDVSSLKPENGLILKVTIVSDNYVADGLAKVLANGEVGYWDAQPIA